MNSQFWIVKTEVRQNLPHFLLMALVALIFGYSIGLGYQAYQKISSLSVHENWNADVVVLPKGLTLEDLHQELLTGTSKALLPEALFDTTVGMAQNQFELGAVLALTDKDGPRVMVKGPQMGIAWLVGRQKIDPWQEQQFYSTPEWKNKVITAFFASGPEVMMKNLKDLVDRRTVGQAFWIKDQMARDAHLQEELFKALYTVAAVFAVLVSLLFVTSLLWLKNRLSSSFMVFNEIGLANDLKFKIISAIAALFVLLPVFLGFYFKTSLGL